MYLVAFSYFAKSKLTNNNKEIYVYSVDLKLISACNLCAYIKNVFSMKYSTGEKIIHSFPICIKSFKNKEEIESFRKITPDIIKEIKKIKLCKQKYNDICITKSIYINLFKVNRFVITNKESENYNFQSMELNSMSLEIIGIINNIICSTFDIEEFKRIRSFDKFISKHIKVSNESRNIYTLK